MRLTISTKELLKAINLVSRSISSTIPLPSLTGIYLSAKENELTLIASDANISIKTFLSSDDDKNQLVIYEIGDIVISAKYLHDIIQRFSDPITSLEIIDGTLIELKSGNALFKINGMSPKDYPAIDFENSGSEFKLKTSVLKEIVYDISFACSQDETRPALTGVSLTANGKELLCAATDSFRLAMKKIPLEEEAHFNIVLPSKYLDKIYASVEDEKEIVIKIDSSRMCVYVEKTIISARLIDDKYPNITTLLPNSFTQILTVKCRDLASAIERCSILKSEGNKNIIKMSISNGKVDLRSVSQEIGSSFDSIPTVSYEGEDLIISCSGKYLLDTIKVIHSDTMTLCFNGELRPIIIKDLNDENMIQFVSPVRSYD